MVNSTPKPDGDKAPLEQAVKNLHRAKEEELTKIQADKLGLEYRNLAGFQPDPAAVALVPRDMVQSGHVFAFEKAGTKILLALSDPNNPATVTALKHLAAMDEYQFHPVLVCPYIHRL